MQMGPVMEKHKAHLYGKDVDARLKRNNKDKTCLSSFAPATCCRPCCRHRESLRSWEAPQAPSARQQGPQGLASSGHPKPPSLHLLGSTERNPWDS